MTMTNSEIIQAMKATVPLGKHGDHEIEHFTVSKMQATTIDSWMRMDGHLKD